LTGAIVLIETHGTAFASAIKLFSQATARFTNHSMTDIAPFKTLFAIQAIQPTMFENAPDITSREEEMNLAIELIALLKIS
jgi:hypothetical protein